MVDLPGPSSAKGRRLSRSKSDVPEPSRGEEEDRNQVRREGPVKTGKDCQGQDLFTSRPERTYGVFLSRHSAATRIDPSKVQATMSKGVLKVTIPEARRGVLLQKIEVKESRLDPAASSGRASCYLLP